MRMPAVQKQFQQQLLLSTYSPLLLQRVHLQKQNRFASEDGFYFTATFDTTSLTVRASYTVGTGWYHHGNLTPSRISAGRPLCLRLRLDGSIIVLFPCHCAAPRHRVLSADCIRSIPYSAVSVVINGHRGCLRASHSRLPAWFYPWLRLEENVQYRMDILFSRSTKPFGVWQGLHPVLVFQSKVAKDAFHNIAVLAGKCFGQSLK